MAKKNKRRRDGSHRGFTDAEWREWGENFGRRMTKFGEEMERFGKGMESRERESRHGMRAGLFGFFGVAAPLIGSVIGLVFLLIGILALNFLNIFLGSGFVTSVSGFLYANIGIFFVIFLFAGYNEYLSRRYWQDFWAVSPIMAGIGVVISLWIIAWAVRLINTVPNVAVLTSASSFIFANLAPAFVLVMVLGYAFVITKRILRSR